MAAIAAPLTVDFGVGQIVALVYRVKQLDEEIQTRCGEPRPCHGLRIGHKLRQNLAEQENQECKYYA